MKIKPTQKLQVKRNTISSLSGLGRVSAHGRRYTDPPTGTIFWG